jgi:hypothetical protein
VLNAAAMDENCMTLYGRRQTIDCRGQTMATLEAIQATYRNTSNQAQFEGDRDPPQHETHFAEGAVAGASVANHAMTVVSASGNRGRNP